MGAEIRQRMRKQVLAKRDLLGIRDRHEKSAAITERILSMPGMDSWETLFVYVNFRSEVETLQLIQRCLEKDKRVVVPLVDSAQSTMIALQVTDLDRDLQPGYFDIPEPDPTKTSLVAGKEIDAVILPGSVFDAEGGRLGYGGGYYDRFLVNDAPQACRIGLAFELQVVEAVPLEPHDQRLDYLVTDERIIKTTPLTKDIRHA
jgi:5-formyltetrahydrofolate cyclo-ligase